MVCPGALVEDLEDGARGDTAKGGSAPLNLNNLTLITAH